ncbi:MAG TPA: hypothetical protein PKB14_07505 [Rubrivivax sp.]|nr:hypothetical protein [Rubrivivax sp.]
MARHSKATQVRVSLNWSAQKLDLEVADNGLRYRSRILDKLGVASNAELARYALLHRLID